MRIIFFFKEKRAISLNAPAPFLTLTNPLTDRTNIKALVSLTKYFLLSCSLRVFMLPLQGTRGHRRHFAGAFRNRGNRP